MAEYSDTQTTAKGTTVTAVYNPETSSVTFTLTTPSGKVATVTSQVTPYVGNFRPNSDATVKSIRDQLKAASGGGFEGQIEASGFGDALVSSFGAAYDQADKAQKAATATDTTVPAAPAPPPPTNNATDPAVASAPNNTPPVQNTAPATPPANLAQNAATTNEAAQDKKVPTDDPTVGRTIGGANIDSPAPATVTDPSIGRTPGAAHVDNPAPEPVPDSSIGRTPGAAHVDTVQNPAPKATEIDEDSAYPKNPVDVAAAAKLAEGVGRTPGAAQQGLTVPKLDAQSQSTQQNAANAKAAEDWRVRLSLAPGSTYLYNAKGKEGILLPLAATNGIIFPYTPAIQVQYLANYDPTEITHSNYKFFSYKGSAVDQITITCEFTAQDTKEANYLLAVIHFLRSVTKMFYGKDQNPKNGTPPPLCYLTGLGTYQFDNHPLAVTGFTYSLPTDVDYIRAQGSSSPPGVNTSLENVPSSNSGSISANRLKATGAAPGALANPPVFNSAKSSTEKPTYVPTKISITISAVPIVTRNDISNTFSLKDYATGSLLRGTQRKGGGIW
jgi:hypothetical protein